MKSLRQLLETEESSVPKAMAVRQPSANAKSEQAAVIRDLARRGDVRPCKARSGDVGQGEDFSAKNGRFS